MLRNAASKVMWVGRATVFLVGLSMILAVVLGVATAALGATGDNFILGQANNAGAASKLTANVAGPALNLVNNSTDAAATALKLQVASGKPPMTVNSSQKVRNLNADQLDGKDSSELGQMWAVVNYTGSGCTLVRGSGALGINSGSICGVRFDRDISGCAYTASLSEPGTGYPGADRTGEVWAFLDNGASNDPTNNTVYVRTADSTGDRTPLPFHVIVVC